MIDGDSDNVASSLMAEMIVELDVVLCRILHNLGNNNKCG
jgi:hypothetical protein